MTEPNAADRKWVREQQKLAKLVDARNQSVVVVLMSSPDGRAYLWDKLEAAHIFHTSFSTDLAQMSFNEGERNLGLQLLNDIIRWSPDQYIQMIREANGRRSDSSNTSNAADEPDAGERSSSEDAGGDTEGPSGEPATLN